MNTSFSYKRTWIEKLVLLTDFFARAPYLLHSCPTSSASEPCAGVSSLFRRVRERKWQSVAVHCLHCPDVLHVMQVLYPRKRSTLAPLRRVWYMVTPLRPSDSDAAFEHVCRCKVIEVPNRYTGEDRSVADSFFCPCRKLRSRSTNSLRVSDTSSSQELEYSNTDSIRSCLCERTGTDSELDFEPRPLRDAANV